MINLANCITASRIVAAAMILFTTPFSTLFYILYAYSGISDMVDGMVARKTGTVSKKGETMDSIADIAFMTVCVVKIFGSIKLEKWFWLWGAIIALIRIVNAMAGVFLSGKLIFIHTIANRLTGLLLFVWVATIPTLPLMYTLPVVGIAATFASVQEGYLILRKKDNVNIKD